MIFFPYRGTSMDLKASVPCIYERVFALHPSSLGVQERNRRPGTENIPGAVGLGAAAELAVAHMEENAARISVLRDWLIDGVLERIPFTRLNGPRRTGCPTTPVFALSSWRERASF